MAPPILMTGSVGNDVLNWQSFLVSKGLLTLGKEAQGRFEATTEKATKDFQTANSLDVDGKVGPLTRAKAIELGWDGGVPPGQDPDPEKRPDWPPAPAFAPPDQNSRDALFGSFSFTPAPTKANPEGILITDNWVSRNLVTVEVPQLQGVSGGPLRNGVLWHRAGADQLTSLFKAWEDAGLLPLILSWAGSYNPRFIRGSTTVLSNHSYGTAFDINAPQNWLGQVPALVGKTGSVRKLVPIANDHGFFWGGHYSARPDGMHFELAKLP